MLAMYILYTMSYALLTRLQEVGQECLFEMDFAKVMAVFKYAI